MTRRESPLEAPVRESRPAGPSSPGSVIARNSLLNLAGLGTPLLVALFAIPPLVAGLGVERFGILGLVWVVAAYLNLLDFGLGRATTRFAATAMRGHDPGELRAIVGVAAALQLGLGLAGAVLVFVLAPVVVTQFLQVSGGLERDAIRSLMLLALAAPVATVTSGFRGLLEAGQRFGYINAVRVPVSAGNFLVPLIGIALGWSLAGMVAGIVLVRAAGLAAYVWACLRAWPELRGPVRPGRALTRQLLGFGGWVTVSALVSSLMIYADRFVIGARLSMESVGFYTVPNEMVLRLEILPASLILTLFPALAALGAAADNRTDRARLFGRSVEALLTLVAPLLLGLVVFGGDVLTVWMGAEFAVNAAPALRLLALGMVANALAFVPHAALQAVGRPDITARFHLLELPFFVLLLWWWVGQWGITGAAAAWMCRAALDSILLMGAAAWLGLGRGGYSRLGRVLGSLVALVALMALAAYWTADAVAGVSALILLLLSWLAWSWTGLLGAEERARLRAAVRV